MSPTSDGPLTYDGLLARARQLEGQSLKTVSGKPFTVGISRTDEIFFTPASSGWGQTEGRKGHQRFVERFNEIGSLQPKDYSDVSRNASYLIGLLSADEEATDR
jgi:hypothetical protein